MVKMYFKKLLFGGIYFGVFIAFYIIFGPTIMSAGLSFDNMFLRAIVMFVPSVAIIVAISFYNRINMDKMSREYLAMKREEKTDVRKYLRSLPDIRMEALAFATIEVVFAVTTIKKPTPKGIFESTFLLLGFFIAFVAIDLLVWVLVVRKWERNG